MAWEIEPGWIIASFGGLFTTLSGVVAWMGAHFNNALRHCETKHDESSKQNLALARELAEVKGELKGIKLFAAPELAKNVAKAVVEAMKHENT